MRFERLAGLGSSVFYVYAGERYLGVVSETTAGEWLAAEPGSVPLATRFGSAEEAGRGLAACACGSAPATPLPPHGARAAAATFAPSTVAPAIGSPARVSARA